MIYTNVKLTACILVTVLLATTFAKPGFGLKEKLARLLMDPENDDANNEIFDHDDDWQQRNQLRGMLLQNNELPARFMKTNMDLKNIFKNMKFFDEPEETTTTTPAPTHVPKMVMVGMAPFRQFFNRFMDMLRH